MFPESYVKQDVFTENMENGTGRASSKRRRVLGILSEQLTGPTESNQEDNYDMVPQINWQKQRERTEELEATLRVCEEKAAQGEEKYRKRIRELEEKLKVSEEKAARIEKEVVENKAQLGKLLESDLKCMTCFELVRDPQVLQCGHSACSLCLHEWFTDEQNGAENEGTGHGFPSVVNQQKFCPYCHVVIQLPPAPDYRLYNVLNTMTSRLPTVPWRVQRDNCQGLWDGIFQPESLNASPPEQTRRMQSMIEQNQRAEERQPFF